MNIVLSVRLHVRQSAAEGQRVRRLERVLMQSCNQVEERRRRGCNLCDRGILEESSDLRRNGGRSPCAISLRQRLVKVFFIRLDLHRCDELLEGLFLGVVLGRKTIMLEI